MISARVITHRVSLKGEPLVHRTVRIWPRYRWAWQVRLPGNRTLVIGAET